MKGRNSESKCDRGWDFWKIPLIWKRPSSQLFKTKQGMHWIFSSMTSCHPDFIWSPHVLGSSVVIYYHLNDKAPKNVQAIGLAHWLNVQTAIFRKEVSVCAILDGLIRFFLLRGKGNFPSHMVLMAPLCSVLLKPRAECHKIFIHQSWDQVLDTSAESSERQREAGRKNQAQILPAV